MNERETLTIPETCAVLGIHERTGYRMVRDGTFPIPVLDLGRRRVISRVLLDRYLAGDLMEA